MRIRPKSVKAQINLLTNPSPVAMSLVDQGACQTPFNVVKRANVHTEKGTDPMTKLRLRKGKGAKAKPAVTKMHLSKSLFPTEDDVTTYLETKGVEGYGDITDGDDVWVVPTGEDIDEAQIVGKAHATPGLDPGVTVFIVELSDEPAAKRASKVTGLKPVDKKKPAAKTAKAAGGDEDEGEDEENGDEGEGDDDEAELVEAGEPLLDLSTKYDWWGAYMSDEKTLTDVIKSGMSYDALPPGMDEIMLAVSTTTGNILADSDLDATAKSAALVQLGSEFASITVDLYNVFTKAVDDSTKAVDANMRKSAKKFVNAYSEAVTAARKGVTTPDDDNVIIETGEEEEGEAPDAGTAAILKQLETMNEAIGTISAKQVAQDKLLSRSQKRQSMSDSIVDLVGEEEEEDPTEVQRRKQARQDMGSALGARPRSTGE